METDGPFFLGGMSFYSPQHGFICSNVISYEVVLADGSIVNASAEENSDLWRAFKGGGNNFGVVARFTVPAFPAGKIWSGSFISPGFRAVSTFTALHEYAKKAGSGEAFDERAAPPIVSIAYMTRWRLSLFHTYLVYTESHSRSWPKHFQNSPFKSIWNLHKEIKQETARQAVNYLGSLSPPGKRNVYATTTIRNDLKTILDAHTIWRETLSSIKHLNNSVFVLVFQVILPQWMNKGDPNMLGLQDCKEPLLVLEAVCDWTEIKEDQVVKEAAHRCIERIEQASEANGTSHPFRFQNYCSERQRPLDGFGSKSLRFMQNVSQKYDPDGLFQAGGHNGFRLNMAKKDAFE